MNTLCMLGKAIISPECFKTNIALIFFLYFFMYFLMPDQRNFMTEQSITNSAFHFGLDFRMANIGVLFKTFG